VLSTSDGELFRLAAKQRKAGYGLRRQGAAFVGAEMTRMDDDELKSVVSRLFYLLTAMLEDGGALAAEGQASDLTKDRATDLANRLHSVGQHCMILADAVIALGHRAAN
jgi:hypothetical protein